MVKQYLQADYSLQEALSDIKEHSLIEGISNVIDLVNKNKLVAIVKTPPKSMFARVELESQLKPIEKDNGLSFESLTVLAEHEITINNQQIGFTTTPFSSIKYFSDKDIVAAGIFQHDDKFYTGLKHDDGSTELLKAKEMSNIEIHIEWMKLEPDPAKPLVDYVFTYAEIDDIRITSESLEKLRPKVTSDSLSRSPQVIQHTNTTPQYIKTTQNLDELLNRFHHHQAQEKLPEINLELINEFLSEGLKIYLKMPGRMSSFWSDELKKEPENDTAQRITHTANSSHATLGSVGYDESESRYYVNSIKVDDEAFELPDGFDIVTKEYLNSLNTSLRHNMEKTCFFAEITRDDLKEFEQKLGIYDHGVKQELPQEAPIIAGMSKAQPIPRSIEDRSHYYQAVHFAISNGHETASQIYKFLKDEYKRFDIYDLEDEKEFFRHITFKHWTSEFILISKLGDGEDQKITKRAFYTAVTRVKKEHKKK